MAEKRVGEEQSQTGYGAHELQNLRGMRCRRAVLLSETNTRARG